MRHVDPVKRIALRSLLILNLQRIFRDDDDHLEDELAITEEFDWYFVDSDNRAFWEERGVVIPLIDIYMTLKSLDPRGKPYNKSTIKKWLSDLEKELTEKFKTKQEVN